MICYKYSITCQDDLLTVDNAQSHVTAFRPISDAARSWSDDNMKVHCRVSSIVLMHLYCSNGNAKICSFYSDKKSSGNQATRIQNDETYLTE